MQRNLRSTLGMLAVAMILAWGASRATAHHVASGDGVGQSFLFGLQPPFTQSLFGVSSDITSGTVLGGIAFAPDGDVWVADCVFSDTGLHRFDLQDVFFIGNPINGTTSLHSETIVDSPQTGGCGLVNGAEPDGSPNGVLYSNSSKGVFRLDADTGLPVAWPFDLAVDPMAPPRPIGPQGNGLGIAVDPQTGNVIYVGSDCVIPRWRGRFRRPARSSTWIPSPASPTRLPG